MQRFLFYISNNITDIDDKYNCNIKITLIEKIRYKIYSLIFNKLEKYYKDI